MISNAKDICTLSLWFLGCFSVKLFLETFYLLEHLIILVVVGHHPSEDLLRYVESRRSIDIHGLLSSIYTVKDVSVELFHKFHLLRFILHDLKLKNIGLDFSFTEKVIYFLQRFCFFIIVKSVLASRQCENNLFGRNLFK